MFRTTALILLSLLPVYASPADDRLVVLENDAAIRLGPESASLTVLVKPGKGQIDLKDQPRIAGLYLSGDNTSVEGFAARWVGRGRPEAIEITLDRKAMLRSGTYDLYLDLQPNTKPDAERLRLQIVHPEPKLSPLPKLLIDRTKLFFGWRYDTHPDLTLVESSNLSNFTNVRIEQLTNTVLGAKQIGGTLHIPDSKADIKAGHATTYHYDVVNDFDLGTASGTLTVAAAESNGPIGSIDFEVRTHLHWIYIGLTIIAGLLASYLLKVHLQMKLDLDRARLDARKLHERVTQEETKHLDPEFRNAYKDKLKALDDAIKGDDPSAINLAKTDLDTAWRAALQALTTRHQEQEAALSKIEAITKTDWLVPTTVRAAVEAAKELLPGIHTALENDDLLVVREKIGNCLDKIGDGIRAAALAWQLCIGEILNQLLGGPKGISKSISGKLDKPAQDLRGSLNRVSETTALSTPEQILQTLTEIKAERISVAQFFIWLKIAVSTEVSAVAAEFNQLESSKWNSTAFSRITIAEAGIESFLSAVADNPNPQDLPAALSKQHAAWSEGLQGQFAVPLEELKPLLDARDYQQAANIALDKLKRNYAMLGDEDQMVAIGFRVPGFIQEGTAVSPSPVYAMQTHFQTMFTADPVMPTSFTDAKQVKLDKLWQSLIIGFFLVVLGYSLQLATFVGTFTEISTLFFWAFGLDLTLDTVRTLSAKKTT